jgi:hypothetical protein
MKEKHEYQEAQKQLTPIMKAPKAKYPMNNPIEPLRKHFQKMNRINEDMDEYFPFVAC